MPASYSAEEIIELTQGRMAQGMVPDDAGAVTTDTRVPLESTWFVALVGKNFDGHDFIGDAFCAGALGCIVEDRGSYPIAATSFPLIAVDDTEEALGALAKNWRKRTLKKLALVTASSLSEPSPVAQALAQRTLRQHTASHPATGGAAVDSEDFEPDEAYVDWRKNVSEILCGFLGLDDDLRYVVADFAPSPLDKAAWLVEILKPDLVIITGDGYQYDRLSGSHHLPAEVLRSIVGAVARLAPIKALDNDHGAVKPVIKAHAPQVVCTDAELAQSLGVKHVTGVDDIAVAQALGLTPTMP
ncbi:MAG: hypothetical protein IPP57_11375 [Candidatus Obscuribacter sp.]|nr:hypothetical protein [Candidatus Obscuribacter sp.]